MIGVRARRLLDIAPRRPGEKPFVAAASGLCELNGMLFVVADDEHTLAVFPVDGDEPGTRHLLLRPDAQDHASMPKPLKPDLEAICVLPRGALLAVPSGSTPLRCLGAVISLDGPHPVSPARPLDFAPLFERLAHTVGAINLEGAAVVGSRLWLANRGNTESPSALFEIDLNGLAGHEVPASAFLRAVTLDLGAHDGVPFTPTDLAALPDGRLLVSAVCEDTADSYNDGACLAAAIAVVQPGAPPERFARLSPTYKVEGLIHRDDGTLWMVCDADDPSRPSPLLEGRLG